VSKFVLSSFILFFLISPFSLLAQGKGSISGTVIDKATGETLPGASISIEGTTTGTMTDIDGKFKLSNLAVGSYRVQCTMVSFAKKILTGVEVKDGAVTNLNIVLETVQNDLKEVIIEAEAKRESINALVLQQKNAASVSDGISAETIKKTPDRTTSDVLRRISGASIQDNKFAIIRGLNDRYNASYINGAPLPSSESDRKAFSFDIFPANMLDNIVINKTATPDMPAEFAGGIIQINTKSIPEENFQSFSISSGYNTMTTGKTQLTYNGGKTDWLGVDDGTRALPSAIPAKKDFPTLPAQQADLGKNFSNDWGINSGTFAPNMNFQYSLGHTVRRKEKDVLGLVFAASYQRTYNYLITERKGYSNSTDPSVPSQLDFDYTDNSYATQTLAGLLGNVAFKLNKNNTISFKNLFSINADDRVIRREGTPTPLEENPLLIRSTAQWFTSNRIYTGQLIGDHLVAKGKIKVNWVGGFSSIQRSIPNLRRNVYTRLTNSNDPTDPANRDTVWRANISKTNVGPDYGGGMFFSENKEQVLSFRADASYNWNPSKTFKNEIKIGASYQQRDREFFARQMGYTQYSTIGGGSVKFQDSLTFLSDDQLFASTSMGLIAPGKGGFKLKDATKNSDSYTAGSKLSTSYLMVTSRYKEWFRLVWGVRVEAFQQTLNATLDNNQPLVIDTKKTDILPSANAVFSISDKQNIRASYSQTLNRPEFRELAPFAFYDFNTQFVYSGNDTLKRALIHNYDVRWELYPGRAQLISATAFYKSFINPIEQISRADVANEVSFKNVAKAKSYGAELEFRTIIGALLKKSDTHILNNLTIYANYAWIRSAVDVSGIIGSASESRPLQGQSPFVFNAGLIYANKEKGYSLSAAVNRVGTRIAIVGNVNEPDIWENGRTVLDLQASKSFLKQKLEAKLFLRDGLAQKLYFFQDRNDNKRFDKDSDNAIWVSKFAPTFSASLTYKF
jgi:TonB-dependent receptor